MDTFDDEQRSPPTGELPIADYKHLPKRTVEGHVPLLGRDELELVLRYEIAHRARTPLIRQVTLRLRQLRQHTAPETPGGFGSTPLR